MGSEAALLLVSLRVVLVASAGAAALASCQRAPEPVRAADHTAFFLWAGVEAPPDLTKAKTVYLLAGEVRAGGPARFVPLRAIPHTRQAAIWLAVRVERLDWDDALYGRVIADLARWEAAGNRVAGLQVDFDARTRGLADYAAFLTGLRRRLPPRYRLSATGLLDWSAGGDPRALASLAGVVDEVVIQTYQGRRTIRGYERYMSSLARLPLTYRIGLVEGGEWREPPEVARDPEFKGYVVFLLPPG